MRADIRPHGFACVLGAREGEGTGAVISIIGLSLGIRDGWAMEPCGSPFVLSYLDNRGEAFVWIES